MWHSPPRPSARTVSVASGSPSDSTGPASRPSRRPSPTSALARMAPSPSASPSPPTTRSAPRASTTRNGSWRSLRTPWTLSAPARPAVLHRRRHRVPLPAGGRSVYRRLRRLQRRQLTHHLPLPTPAQYPVLRPRVASRRDRLADVVVHPGRRRCGGAIGVPRRVDPTGVPARPDSSADAGGTRSRHAGHLLPGGASEFASRVAEAPVTIRAYVLTCKDAFVGAPRR